MSSSAPARRYMSSRSNGVTKVRLRRSTTSCVRRSPSCSRSLICFIRPPPSSGKLSRSCTRSRAISTVFADACVYSEKNSRFWGVSRRRAILRAALYHGPPGGRARTRRYPVESGAKDPDDRPRVRCPQALLGRAQTLCLSKIGVGKAVPGPGEKPLQMRLVGFHLRDDEGVAAAGVGVELNVDPEPDSLRK